MQQSTKILRPATAALAVALAGAAAPLWAQDAAVAPPPVITTAPAAAPAPVIAPPVAATVTPPPIARTTTPDAAASRTAVNAEALAQAEADRPAPVRAAAPVAARAAPAGRAAPAPRVAAAPAPVAAEPAPVAAVEPTVQPPVAQPANDSAAMAAAMAPNEPAAAEEANTDGGIPLNWLLGGLGALALLGIAAAVLMRRRGEAEYQEVHSHPELVDAPAAPVVHHAPVAAPAAALATGPVRTADGRLIGRHEALAMQGPTPDNPFLTERNRLKRARFYDRQERVAGMAQRPAMPFDPKPATVAAQAPARDAGVVRANVRPARQSNFGWPGTAKPALG